MSLLVGRKACRLSIPSSGVLRFASYTCLNTRGLARQWSTHTPGFGADRSGRACLHVRPSNRRTFRYRTHIRQLSLPRVKGRTGIRSVYPRLYPRLDSSLTVPGNIGRETVRFCVLCSRHSSRGPLPAFSTTRSCGRWRGTIRFYGLCIMSRHPPSCRCMTAAISWTPAPCHRGPGHGTVPSLGILLQGLGGPLTEPQKTLQIQGCPFCPLA